MQGKKIYTPKLMYQVHLDTLVSKDNFYRKLESILDFNFLYNETSSYYGTEGQESIDPVVFFKISLVGYLNNINSDRKLIEFCSNCLDVRLFLKYDIDESLPWHSTISRTRQLLGEEVFLALFKKVLSLCINKGMVRGKRQAIDSAFVKANASLDSLKEKVIIDDAVDYFQDLNDCSEFKMHQNQTKQANNRTHYSSTDPEARISVKPGKATNLNYFGQISVDDSNHLITGAIADFADKKDSQCLPNILTQTINNLKDNHIQIDEIVADTNYSSGESIKFCKKNQINAFIPNTGSYKNKRDGFIYNKENDCFECTKGNQSELLFKRNFQHKNGHWSKEYLSQSHICKTCPVKSTCIKNSKYKKITVSFDAPLYKEMHEKMSSKYAKRLIKIRSKTVEPVLGTLLNYLNMKRVNARGISQASKHVLMAALCYNIKKYLKFNQKMANSKLEVLEKVFLLSQRIEFSVKNDEFYSF